MKPPTPGLGAGEAWAEVLKRSSFGSAALLLEPTRRADLALFYAYCRAIDDCADEFVPREALAHLKRWDAELTRMERGRAQSPLGLGLADL
ncbi:MAG: squalene/phytoene synthase family protein, partial [bacterium]